MKKLMFVLVSFFAMQAMLNAQKNTVNINPLPALYNQQFTGHYERQISPLFSLKVGVQTFSVNNKKNKGYFIPLGIVNFGESTTTKYSSKGVRYNVGGRFYWNRKKALNGFYSEPMMKFSSSAVSYEKQTEETSITFWPHPDNFDVSYDYSSMTKSWSGRINSLSGQLMTGYQWRTNFGLTIDTGFGLSYNHVVKTKMQQSENMGTARVPIGREMQGTPFVTRLAIGYAF